MTLSKNTPYHLTVIVVFILLKLGYTIASTSDLNFMLNPVNKLVHIFTGYQSIYIPNSGYYYQDLEIIIDKSCSGFNFCIICFIMLFFLSLNHLKTIPQKTISFLFSFIAAYILTIFVNSSRIFASIIIQKQNLSALNIDSEIVHEAIGIITNLSFLILIYLTVELTLKKYYNEKYT